MFNEWKNLLDSIQSQKIIKQLKVLSMELQVILSDHQCFQFCYIMVIIYLKQYFLENENEKKIHYHGEIRLDFHISNVSFRYSFVNMKIPIIHVIINKIKKIIIKIIQIHFLYLQK